MAYDMAMVWDECTDVCRILSYKRSRVMFSSWKINSLLGHQHILVHKISFSLLKRKIRQRYKVDLCDSLPLGLRTVLLIDLQPTFWNLWFLNSY